MKKVVIASKSPVKIQSVKNGFEKMFPNQEFEFISVKTQSNVSDQPFSDKETFTGAKNRVDSASNVIKDADFYVGIEGGIELIEEEMEAFAWMVVKSNGKYGKSRTGTFFLPKAIVKLIKEGKELGEADDMFFKRKNTKSENGSVGLLTGDVIVRTEFYTEAIILALIPFKNVDMY